MGLLIVELRGLEKNRSSPFGCASSLSRPSAVCWSASSSSFEKLLEIPSQKAVAACVTLGTGNSLGLEGSSVEIGASIAKGVNSLFNKSPQTGLPLLAAGSASGISSAMVEINSSSSVGAVKEEQEHVEEECSRKR